MSLSDNESLVTRYLHAWYSQDFEVMRRCLADDVRFDMGIGPSFDDADDLVEFCRAAPTFRDLTLLELLTQDDRVALVFDGIRADTGTRSRSALFVRVEEGKICSIVVSASPLDVELDDSPSTWRSRDPVTLSHGTLL